MVKTKLSTKKTLKNMLIVVITIFVLLTVRIGWIQMVQGSELQTMAYVQQTLDRNINPKRGNIYDATGKVLLATSASVETVTINPTNIKTEDKQKVAECLANTFNLKYDDVLKKVNKKTSIETIIKKVDKDKTDQLREWMQQNGINSGINIDEDTKRYYPYQTLASQVIGFCGSDNQGLDGIEAKYDDILKGQMGKIQKVMDATGGNADYEKENYIPAIDGKDLVISIDMTVQSIAEKYLKNACVDNKCTDGGNIIIMNPKTGDVLAMAEYPDYNLNSPYDAYTPELSQTWDNLSEADQMKELQKVWRNKAISDGYEPGSVFKILTASAALQEGIAEVDKAGEFYDPGYIIVDGVKMQCWRYYNPHGSESLRQALMNSCNPVFIGLGEKLGVKTYFSYLQKFGMLERTGIDLYGEANSIFLKESKVGPIELATYAFGQRFEVTPIQMVRMASVIANGGKLVTPRIVKQIIDPTTGEKTDIPVKISDNVISEQTAKNVLSMMGSVVSEGTGKGSQVAGYSIAGKTGTSEDGVNTGKYIASFMAIAPMEDPELVMLITLYNPTGEGGHQGGGIVAPLSGQILSEVLPYLGVVKKVDDTKPVVTVPELRGMSITDAQKAVKELGLKLSIRNKPDGELDESKTIIVEQSPKPGIKINQDNTILVDI
ncbi:MAG: penicillin-binding transpeptidase domain-containing protein [Oscillospiraceae bacterium]|nr:penicillin-binding transpeptidase domain-containing protein [Oscillospiraceae bacterium]